MKASLQQFTEPPARAMKLSFRVANRPIHDLRDFLVLVALDVVEFDNQFVARRQLLYSSFQIDAIERTG